MKSIAIIVFLFTSFTGRSQVKESWVRQLHFSSINTIGLSTGSSGESMNIQTINGIRYKSWNLGIGTGIDWCGIKSIPLLADIRKTLSRQKHKPFVYANAGINFLNNNGTDAYYGNKRDYKNGFVSETGLGYKLQLRNQTSLVLSAGFQYKHDRYEDDFGPNFFIWPSRSGDFTRYDNYYRRILIRLGISF